MSGDVHAPLVVQAAQAFGKAPASAVVDRLSTWLGLVAQWNARMDLTAARSPEALVDLMVVDAIILARHIEEGVRVVDVGSGAGAPGLALGLLRPDLVVTLVEPLRKRASFLRTVLGTLGRAGLALEARKGESLADEGARFDAAISRATLRPAAWLELGRKLVREGGSVWVLLAKEDPPELRGLELADRVEYAWPLTGATRRAVRYLRQ